MLVPKVNSKSHSIKGVTRFVLSLGTVIAIFSSLIFNVEKIVGSKNLLPSSSCTLSLYHWIRPYDPDFPILRTNYGISSFSAGILYVAWRLYPPRWPGLTSSYKRFPLPSSFMIFFSLFSFILAWTFISLQIKEFRIMGLSINDSVYNCVFFFLTGLHFFHLVVGLLLLSLLFWSCSFSEDYRFVDGWILGYYLGWCWN